MPEPRWSTHGAASGRTVMAATGTWAMSSLSARIGVPRVRARHPRRSVSRMMGRMNDIAIEEQSSHPEEDPADFGVERGVPFTRRNAFYRVESAQARDLAILLAAVMSDEAVAASSSTFRDAERISGGISVLDAMSGCGIRCARYLLQGEVSSVHANDANPNVMASLDDNLSGAHMRGATGVSCVTNLDAHRLLGRCYLDDTRYDVVDVDSFGAENLVSATMRCVKRGGYAYLTSTDALALCGKSPGTLSANYGGAYVAPNTQGANEHGLRVFVGDAVRIGAAMGLKVTPVFSLFHPHGPVFRTMCRVDALVGDWSYKSVGHVGRCRTCGDGRVIDPSELGGAFCHRCDAVNARGDGTSGTETRRSCLEVSGPMWLGSLHESETVEKLRSKATEKRWIGEGASVEDTVKVKGQMTLEALLNSFAAEADPRLPPYHHRTDELGRGGRGLRRGIPGMKAWVDELKSRGFAACKTHVDSRGLKTNAPMEQVIDAANAVTRARDMTSAS